MQSSQTRNSPIIVGDRYELAETVAASYTGELFGGLLAKPNYGAALLPMSGYEKSPNADLNDFNARRSSQAFASLTDYNASRAPQEPMYLQYSLPGLADAQLQSPSTAYDRHADQVAYGASSEYEPRAAYEATEPGYNDFEARKIPKVTSYSPQRGATGSQVYVYLDSSSDLLEPSPLIVSLMFAKRRVPASLTRLETRAHDSCYKYVVNGNAPSFLDTASPSVQVPLRLQLQESSGLDAGLIDIGRWQYDDGKQLELRSSPEISRKRKNTSDSEDVPTSAKRLSSSQPDSQEYGSYSYVTDSSLAYPQSLHSIDLSSMQRRLTPYGRSQTQHNLQDDSTSMSVHNFTGDSGDTQSLMRPPTTQNPSYNPSYTASYHPGRSPRLDATPSFQFSTSSSPNSANPPLARATTLQQQPGSASTSAASSSDGTFNPYATFPNRAIIKIRGGDLDSMQNDWTPDERAAKRRLVRFRGEQSGTTINTYFQVVKSNERPSPHELRERCVSCIYWEEKDEYFVTSVDTIALLETLVGARFTVEEKNRIRRNLETHHPLTVSKAKPDTESFFKVIMGFPPPKPRNIEKDVKVFPWTILHQALRKVIGKYSASHASTAGPLSTPRASNYSSARSDTSSDRYSHLSSRSSNTASSGYTQTLKSSTLSPALASHGMPIQYSQTSPLPNSSLSQAYTVPTLASQYSNDPSYAVQISLPDQSLAYTTSAIGRRRSSEATIDTFGSTHYPTRPRANTSFSAMYQSAQDPAEYSLGQMPSSVQPARASWDMNAFLQSEPGSISAESASQYRLPSRQNSQASQYTQETTIPETSRSTTQ